MKCSEAIEYIHSLEKFGIKPGLERIYALCELLGNPQDKLKIIHVAGTNGKGSTSTVISKILMEAGYNTGLYISPYVVDFRERIQYNGNMIEHSELAECVETVKTAVEKLAESGEQTTEFEALTATAFLYFERKKCDFVVLEVGLGGRFDATNVIKAPYVSVIASISLDHTAILGNTVAEIAAEKCGIIKFGSETVSYPFQKPEALEVIEETCKKRMNELRIPDMNKLHIHGESVEGTSAVYDGIEFLLPLAGKHMVFNTCTAIEAIRSLGRFGYKIPDEVISSGISKAVMPARTELIKKKPIIILDGGHNEGCALALADFIRKHLASKRIIAVSSMMADKDYNSYLRIVAPLTDVFIATRADVPRALSSDELCAAALLYCGNCNSISDPIKAVNAARNIVEADDVLLVCGSFYLAGEVRDELMNF